MSGTSPQVHQFVDLPVNERSVACERFPHQPVFSVNVLIDIVKPCHAEFQGCFREIGLDTDATKRFPGRFLYGAEYAAIDMTHVFSLSEDAISSTIGHDGESSFTPRVKLLYLFDLGRMMPAYFRILASSTNTVSPVKLTASETGARNVVVVGDMEFYSAKNVKELWREGLQYVLPLRRNSRLIDYRKMKGGTRKAFDGHFIFEQRMVWHYGYGIDDDGRSIFVFPDSWLKEDKEKHLVDRGDHAGEFFEGGKVRYNRSYYGPGVRCKTSIRTSEVQGDHRIGLRHLQEHSPRR